MTTIYVQVPLPVAHEWMIASPVERVEKLSEFLGVTLSQETEITQLLKGSIEENGSKNWDCVYNCYSVMTGQFVIDTDRTSMICNYLLNVSKYPDVTVWVKIINSGYEEAMTAKEHKQAIADDPVLVIKPVIKVLKEKGFGNIFSQFSKWVNSDYMNLSVLAKILSRLNGDTDEMIEVILNEFAKQQRSIGEQNALKRLQDQVVDPESSKDKAYEEGYKQAIADVIEEYESYDQLSYEESPDFQSLTDTLADIKESIEILTSELAEVEEDVDEICQQGSDFCKFLNRKYMESDR